MPTNTANSSTDGWGTYSPNLNCLSGRMRYAANVLEEVSIHFQAYDPSLFRWNADQLRVEAGHVENEEFDASISESSDDE